MNAPRLAAGTCVVSALLALLASIPSPAAEPARQSISIDERKELFVRDVAVVDDARAQGLGPWSFGGLMSAIAGDNDPAGFVTWWLQTWECPQVVNGVAVFDKGKANSMRTFRDTWTGLGSSGDLELALAPFRLCAIVNRPDLLKIDAQGVVTSAGELRFVFCHTSFTTGVGRPFFVIFEFQVPASSPAELKAYHEQWHALAAFDLEDPVELAEYLAALETITSAVTERDDESGRPNGSNLAQVRTNEFDLPGGSTAACASPGGQSVAWDLREFALMQPGTAGPLLATLQNTTTKQTPHIEYLGSFCPQSFGQCTTCDPNDPARDLLGEYLDDNAADILAGIHVVPDQYQFDSGLRWLQSGHAPNDTVNSPRPPCGLKDLNSNGATLWWATGYDGRSPDGTDVWTRETSDVRHKFALQTCSGCHHSETGTIPQPNDFSMVSERNANAESQLAGFLIGTTVLDPVEPDVSDEVDPVVRAFHDLANREDVLREILAMGGTGGLPPVPVLQQIRAAMGTRVH